MPVKSSTLFHFTPRMEYLKSIIEHGFFPRYCQEDRSWLKKLNLTNGKYEQIIDALYPMICFCDIPLSKIHNHIEFYGAYGVGISKKWGIANNLNPVWYISRQINAFPILFSKSIEAYQNLNRTNEIKHQNNLDDIINEDLNEIRNFLVRTLIFVKPISGQMKNKEKAFDEESEWRYVPPIDDIQKYNQIVLENNLLSNNLLDKSKELLSKHIKNSLSKKEKIEFENLVESSTPLPVSILIDKFKTDEELEQHKFQKNELMKNLKLSFNLSDINYLFVSNDDEVIELIKFIYKIHGKNDETHLLVSKIISLKTLMKDL